MTNQKIDEFMRLWSQLARKEPDKDESMSLLLELFVDALSMELINIREDEHYAVAEVNHRGLKIYKNNKALLFCIHCEFDEESLDLYSSIKSVVYGHDLTGQPAAMLILKSNPIFDAYCDESPIELVRFSPKFLGGVLRASNSRFAFSAKLREIAKADVINPYSTVGPVRGSMFFGRRSELQMITNLDSEQSRFALLGARKSGKTSILLNAREKLRN